MTSRRTAARPRRLKPSPASLILVAAILAVLAAGLVFTARSRAQEREFKNTVPERVPIKVKLKNEEKFKKLDNGDWARDLEVEVKNTGTKPIYFLYMVVRMPEMTNEYGHALAFQFHYGRKTLVSFGEEVLPEDVPILPGESVTLKVSETQLRGFEQVRHLEKTDKPKKVEFDLQLINYGDRTGFQGKDGTPRAFPKERSQYAPGIKQGAGGEHVRQAPRSDLLLDAREPDAGKFFSGRRGLVRGARACGARPVRLPEPQRLFVGRDRLRHLPV